MSGAKARAYSHFLTLRLERWPWQRWDHAFFVERFGGGWRWKLGVSVGSTTVIIDLLFGSIRVSWGAKRDGAIGDEWRVA